MLTNQEPNQKIMGALNSINITQKSFLFFWPIEELLFIVCGIAEETQQSKWSGGCEKSLKKKNETGVN